MSDREKMIQMPLRVIHLKCAVCNVIISLKDGDIVPGKCECGYGTWMATQEHYPLTPRVYAEMQRELAEKRGKS